MSQLKNADAARITKTVVFIALLLGASAFFGITCHRIGGVGDGIFSLPNENLDIFIWMLVAFAAMFIPAGLVAMLLRPYWVCVVAFALSSLTILFLWGLGPVSGGVVAFYFLAGLLYSRGVINGLEERIKFSLRPLTDSQGLLIFLLVVAVCASFYLGYAKDIEEQGFQPPQFVTDLAVKIANPDPGTEAQFRAEFNRQLEETVEPYQQYIPVVVTFALFAVLQIVVTILSLIALGFLAGIFFLLLRLGVTKRVTEMREVERIRLA